MLGRFPTIRGTSVPEPRFLALTRNLLGIQSRASCVVLCVMRGLCVVALGVFSACRGTPSSGGSSEPMTTAASATSLAVASTSAAPNPAPSSSLVARQQSTEVSALDRPTFARLFRELSEPDQYFFSENFVSNETSYLQVADALDQKAMKGGAYIGVGPEQNFTYLAIVEPALAFIVDVRRQNALEHLLYKAIFDQARTRAEFLCLLVGAPCDEASAADANAAIATLIERVDAAWKKRDPAGFGPLHRRLADRITSDYAVALSKHDLAALEHIHHAFFSKGLGIEFELQDGQSHRDYPALRELIAESNPSAQRGGFLATERDFLRVRELEQQNRIVPVVGDFAGEHSLLAIAHELEIRKLPVSVFYVSNVEQYLFEPAKWKHWVKNVEALPTNEQSLFLRCYLDQGRRHPKQVPGHRTATLLQSFDQFRWRQRARGYSSFWQLVTDGVLD